MKNKSKKIPALSFDDMFDDISVNTNTAKSFLSRLAELQDVALRNKESNYKTSLESHPSGIHLVGLNIHIYCVWSTRKCL